MKKLISTKSAFTIAEVALFLALSGFLMLGIIIGANTSISRQRYNDSVNDFGEFLRGAYSDVLNVQNVNPLTDEPGRSATAIYGKFITFGENASSASDKHLVYSYDVVGKAVLSTADISSNVLTAMSTSTEIGAEIVNAECIGAICEGSKYYATDTYIIPWDATLEKSDGSQFIGALLVVRSPVTGSIHTYTTTNTPLQFHNETTFLHSSTANDQFRTFISSMTATDLDICIDSDDNSLGNRRDIRVLKTANNSSGVVLVEMDPAMGETRCEGKGA